MRFAVDTGGTFTDLVIEDDAGRLRMFKAQTTPLDPIAGVLDSLQVAADALGEPRADLLARGSMFIHGTTRAINAIITGNTARTALLVTQGHPDVLVLREGGRNEVFNFAVPFPQPYIPRSLTFEIPERTGPDRAVITALDEAAVIEILLKLPPMKVEAIAVCLLWSIVNPEHERRIGALIEQYLPGMPFTLSHALNPCLREYRRASSAAIDASLKPLMSSYMRDLEARLREAGFGGRVFVVTSQAGVIDAAEGAETPIHLINSGPAMAPVAGHHYVGTDTSAATAVVADTGGTTYDISLVRDGRIPWTRETWIGTPYVGHMTGFPSVDVRSIGAGGGSIAAVDRGGLLTVGPRSAGAMPGPACYGKGGTDPTVTDCALVLGHLDPTHFLGGAIRLDAKAAHAAVEGAVARPLGLSVEQAAASVIAVATENMVQAILDITVNQGIDPATAVLIAGGGAAGLNSTMIGRRLGSRAVLVPSLGAALSAAGALMSELTQLYRATRFVTTEAFDFAAANDVLGNLVERGRQFIASAGLGEGRIECAVEARYANQVWEIEVPLGVERFEDQADIERFVELFHATHESVFAIRDPQSPVEIVGWTVRAACRLSAASGFSLAGSPRNGGLPATRRAYFGHGFVDASLYDFGTLVDGQSIAGPAIVESPFTTIVVDPGATARKLASGSLLIEPGR
ncbi:N-methylhydantoinase A [Enhydrobacter aerosaccus]|uniref:N-methylhydantoinase A n=1 Tax=Enhydrobacter aerosaccus TaxID=225324 RepID=A0A1T4JKY1_9HYPH|nr:hydantoinase/oxoprolinase family protein [Enhydrobacter aerosaccus]SJZ30788.1 N-methylhydantoinase A [Enhydrobacter aerosaccus]